MIRLAKILLFIALMPNQISSQTKNDTIYHSFSTISPNEIKKNKELDSIARNEHSIQKFLTSDTLIIYIKKHKNINVINNIQEKAFNSKQIIDTTIIYRFNLKDSSSIEFYYKKYFDFDLMKSDSSTLVLKKNKAYIEKHKSEMLTYKFFKKNKDKPVSMQLRMFREILKNKKVLFVINKEETKDKIITLREVRFNTSSHLFFIDKI